MRGCTKRLKRGRWNRAVSGNISIANRVFSFLRSIPKGETATYGQIARIVGIHPRAVAAILRSNKDPEHIPCYKVVMSDGSIGGYSASGGIKEKIRRLKSDGLTIKKGK